MMAKLASIFLPQKETSFTYTAEYNEGLPNIKPVEEMKENWKTSDPSIVKTEILDFSDQGFLLHRALSQEECDYYISESEKLGYEGLEQHGYKKDYRNNDRVMIKSPELADLLWNRIKEFVTDIHIKDDPSDLHVSGNPILLTGKWEPIGVNEVLRICKYYPGGHFAPHFDSYYAESPDVRTMKTLMLYLNGDFEGGTTNFISEKHKLYKDENGKYCAEEKNIIHRVEPEAGMAIIFNHYRLHEGSALGSGVKYILRSDIMYKKVSGSCRSIGPAEEMALEMIHEAEKLESTGSSMEAMELYRKAYKMCPSLENA